MRTLKKEVAMLFTLGLALQGCMATSPVHTACSGHNVPAPAAPAAPTVNPLARSGIVPAPPPPQLPFSPPPVIRDSPAPGAIPSGVPRFLLNNVTQLLLVCAVSGNCR